MCSYEIIGICRLSDKKFVIASYMTDPILSEDGNFIWDGSKWMPIQSSNPNLPSRDLREYSEAINDIENLLGQEDSEDKNEQDDSFVAINNLSKESTIERNNTIISDSVVMGDINVGVSESEIIDKTKLLIENRDLKKQIDDKKAMAYMDHTDRSLMRDSIRQKKRQKEREKRLERIFFMILVICVVLVFVIF